MGASRMHTLVEAIEAPRCSSPRTTNPATECYSGVWSRPRAELDDYERAAARSPLHAGGRAGHRAQPAGPHEPAPPTSRHLEEDVHRAPAAHRRFREDERPVGEVISDYLARGAAWVANTEQGRSFLDAVRVIGDQATTEGVVSKLELVATAPPLRRQAPAPGGGAECRLGGRSRAESRRSTPEHPCQPRHRPLHRPARRVTRPRTHRHAQAAGVCRVRVGGACAGAGAGPLPDQHPSGGTCQTRPAAWPTLRPLRRLLLWSRAEPGVTLSVEGLRRIGGPQTADAAGRHPPRPAPGCPQRGPGGGLQRAARRDPSSR